MSSGHSHSNRPKLPGHRARDPRPPYGAPREQVVADVARRIRRERRLARRRAELAAGPQKVVVLVPSIGALPPRGMFFPQDGRRLREMPSRSAVDGLRRRLDEWIASKAAELADVEARRAMAEEHGIVLPPGAPPK